MIRGGGAGKKKQPDAIDEVEELLKLTEDDLLLKLTVNSHLKSKSKSKFDFVSESSHTKAIDPDLDRRFEALRSKPNAKTEIPADHEDVDNLFARFAALKAPNATSASNSQPMKIEKDNNLGIVEDEDEEDEVQRIINWAVDAARLDPSPSSDVDEDSNDDVDSDDEAIPSADRRKK